MSDNTLWCLITPCDVWLHLVFSTSLSAFMEPSWLPWSYCSWIYNYNVPMQSVPSTTKVVKYEPRSWRGILDTTLSDKFCQWLATGWWFSPGMPVSSTNKTDRHDLTEILLKVALNTVALTLTLQICHTCTCNIVQYRYFTVQLYF